MRISYKKGDTIKVLRNTTPEDAEYTRYVGQFGKVIYDSEYGSMIYVKLFNVDHNCKFYKSEIICIESFKKIRVV